MRPRILFTVLCGLPLACSESVHAPSDRLAPVFSLTGRVSDLGTGVPLTGATIAVIDGANAGSATSSVADGTYRLVLTPGGLTIRAGYNGYDSVFQGVTLAANTVLDIQMRPIMQTLAGTWTGELSFVQTGTGIHTDAGIPEATVTQAGGNISSTFRTSGPYDASFNGTLSDPSSIASTTETAGTMTVTYNLSGRNPTVCMGAGSFAGTINWTRAAMTAPQIALNCGLMLTSVTISLERQQ